MKILLSHDAFDSIMKACKPFVSKSTDRPALTQIELQSDGKTVAATALDGCKILSISVPCKEQSDSGKMLIPLIKPIGKKGGYAEITDTKTEIIVKTVEHSQIYKKVAADYPDHTRLFLEKDPESTCYFDPKLLADAFSSFVDKTVKVEYYGCTRGLVISTPCAKALVLPMHPPKSENL